MKLSSWLQMSGLRPTFALCGCMVLAHGSLWADGVTRTIEPVTGGCRVTLAWEFAGKVESDLIIEERLAPGWSVDDTTVPFASLDASWFMDSVARFAVNPSLLAQSGSISFLVRIGEGGSVGSVSGDWQMYLSGSLRKGGIAGESALSANTVGNGGSTASAGTDAKTVEEPVTITSFKLTDGVSELSYAGLPATGTLVVEGCEGLGMVWKELKRVAANVGGGTISLTPSEVGTCRFMKMKLLTEEK